PRARLSPTASSPTALSTLSLHDALPICNPLQDQLLKAGLARKSQLTRAVQEQKRKRKGAAPADQAEQVDGQRLQAERAERDRAQIGRARLNSSHVKISYAVFCLKKKKTK